MEQFKYEYHEQFFLEADDLCMHFPAKTDAFGRPVSWIHAADHVTFKVPKGKTLGIVGESGCGKSTVGKMLINLYQPTSGRILYDGVDITRWAEEDLIDTVVVGNMVVYEDLEKFRDEAHPGLIDMDKYREVKYHGLVSPIRRFYDNDVDRMLKAMPPYLELERRTKLTVYFDVPWECTRAPEFFRDYAIRLYEAGAQHISLWDAFHTRVMNRTEWNIVSRLGHRDELSADLNERQAIFH